MSKKNPFIYKNHFAMLNDLAIAEQPLDELISDIKKTYLSDSRPWIIGYSGGKDSTCVLSLIYSVLLQLDPSERTKHVYVVSSDTLVETPVVVDLIDHTLDLINEQAELNNIPVSAHKVVPLTNKTFWTNLLGKGYPAPTQSFRWCTENMKINPVSHFIKNKADEFGEVVVALGSRTQESSSRAQTIKKHSIKGSNLSRHDSLPNAYTYMPIVNWSADDVWQYLMSAPCPWSGDNQLLFELYKGSNQGECPLVIDKSTPSCGNSRFGCWTCTVVTEDKALHGLIESGAKWMQPLLDFRNMLYATTDPKAKSQYRNHKRRTGLVHYWSLKVKTDALNKDGTPVLDENNKKVQISKRSPAKAEGLDSKLSFGPYWMEYRQKWLKQLLEIEKNFKETGHEFKLFSIDELQAIRQEWLRDPNEPDWVDSLPKIYSEVYDTEVEWIENDAGAFTEPDAKLLDELGQQHNVPAELIMKLIEIELSVSGLGKRKGVLDKISTILNKDWESLDEINLRNIESTKNDSWKEKLEELQLEYHKAASL